jgi:hypothetical protein
MVIKVNITFHGASAMYFSYMNSLFGNSNKAGFLEL